MSKVKKIHFMGIGGSGISGISILAKECGYEVDGCDLEKSTDYLDKVKKEKIKVLVGHDERHADSADLVIVSPAILYVNSDHPEVINARVKGKLLTWEEFLAKYLHKGHKVLCIAGTHGKSTTTAMLAKIMSEAGLDPSVTIGATIKEWEANFRNGKSKYFITEADEFNENFLHYDPSVIILNNVEMDHADFFRDKDHVFTSFSKFLQKLSGEKILIYNDSSLGAKRVLEILPEEISRSLKIFGYKLNNGRSDKSNIANIEIFKESPDTTEFGIVLAEIGLKAEYQLGIPGRFNVENAAGVIILAKLYGIKDSIVQKVLKSFGGIGRRLEFIGEGRGIKVYDDYAHHPTAIKATISALRQRYPTSRIWAVNEPHSFSRTNALMDLYKGVFDNADKVIISPVFKARDKETFGVTIEKLASVTGHKDIMTAQDFGSIVRKLSNELRPGDIVLVMGAGKSYNLSRDILNSLK